MVDRNFFYKPVDFGYLTVYLDKVAVRNTIFENMAACMSYVV